MAHMQYTSDEAFPFHIKVSRCGVTSCMAEINNCTVSYSSLFTRHSIDIVNSDFSEMFIIMVQLHIPLHIYIYIIPADVKMFA